MFSVFSLLVCLLMYLLIYLQSKRHLSFAIASQNSQELLVELDCSRIMSYAYIFCMFEGQFSFSSVAVCVWITCEISHLANISLCCCWIKKKRSGSDKSLYHLYSEDLEISHYPGSSLPRHYQRAKSRVLKQWLLHRVSYQ